MLLLIGEWFLQEVSTGLFREYIKNLFKTPKLFFVPLTEIFILGYSARYRNHENVIITNVESVVEAYHQEFEKLWEML